LYESCEVVQIRFFILPSVPAPATRVAGAFLAITRQPLEIERCSNPLRIWEVVQFWLETRFIQSWVWGYLWVTSQAGRFSHFLPSLPGPGRQPNEPFCLMKFEKLG